MSVNNFDAMIPGKYVKGAELQGQSLTYTIKEFKKEEIGQDKEMKFVVYFYETEKDAMGVLCRVLQKFKPHCSEAFELIYTTKYLIPDSLV